MQAISQKELPKETDLKKLQDQWKIEFEQEREQEKEQERLRMKENAQRQVMPTDNTNTMASADQTKDGKKSDDNDSNPSNLQNKLQELQTRYDAALAANLPTQEIEKQIQNIRSQINTARTAHSDASGFRAKL